MVDQAELIRMRGDVIQKSIEIEERVEEIITRHYFGRFFEDARPFMRDVLHDEWFSFGLKIKVLKVVFNNWERGEIPKQIGLPATVNLNKVKRDLEDIRDNRNIFAHREVGDKGFNDNPGNKYEDFLELHKKAKEALDTIREKYAIWCPSVSRNRA